MPAAVGRLLRPAGLAGAIAALTVVGLASGAQQAPQVLGGGYASLDARRQALVDGWVARLSAVSGQPLEAGPLYDEKIKFSTKTTFEAVTHALMTTALTDGGGTRLGDGLDLIERVDTVNGQVSGAGGDHQFRMYVLLRGDAVATLERSREFRRGADNTVFHKGYPINFRAQGGTPSIQISVALDRRHADVDVDYRGSSFPVALFNGHLTSANSDVRAGNNYDRHVNRWSGFTNWWRSFFGVRLDRDAPGAKRDEAAVLPAAPRAGRRAVEVMANDFFEAWIVEGNIAAAMGYVSDRAYACLAEESDDPAAFDRGMAPFLLMTKLKAAKDALGPRATLRTVMVGVRLTNPALKVVTQPHHAQFVVYAVPDDVAASFDCGSRQTPGKATQRRTYGNYFGTVFYAPGPGGAKRGSGQSVALLWAREQGYWKVVSWHTEPEADDLPTPAASVAATPPPARVTGDAGLVQSARDFLQRWLVQRDYDGAFKHLSSAAFGCYNQSRGGGPALSAQDAGKAIRAGLERASQTVGRARTLDAVIAPADPVHPSVRIVDHPHAGTFTLVSIPDSFADLEGCATSDRPAPLSPAQPLEYGKAYAALIRFHTRGGEAPVLRLLWLKEGDVWKIAAYDVVTP
jgi:hypothetical protein